LALGSLRNRDAVMAFLAAQREALIASHDEVMTMIAWHAIFSMGIGYMDALLLASVLLDPRSTLWTREAPSSGGSKGGRFTSCTTDTPN
jgi:hypothetical protein